MADERYRSRDAFFDSHPSYEQERMIPKSGHRFSEQIMRKKQSPKTPFRHGARSLKIRSAECDGNHSGARRAARMTKGFNGTGISSDDPTGDIAALLQWPFPQSDTRLTFPSAIEPKNVVVRPTTPKVSARRPPSCPRTNGGSRGPLNDADTPSRRLRRWRRGARGLCR